MKTRKEILDEWEQQAQEMYAELEKESWRRHKVYDCLFVIACLIPGLVGIGLQLLAKLK